MASETSTQRAKLYGMASMGVEFAGAALGCGLMGYVIDRRYGTEPWGAVVGSMLGLFGGMFRLIQKAMRANRVAAREYRERHEQHEQQPRDKP